MSSSRSNDLEIAIQNRNITLQSIEQPAVCLVQQETRELDTPQADYERLSVIEVKSSLTLRPHQWPAFGTILCTTHVFFPDSYPHLFYPTELNQSF